MRILTLGADGYLGWPTCMYFSKRGHEVIGIDNYFRRMACIELDCEPLIPNPNLIQRAKIWEALTSKKIHVHIGGVTEYQFLKSIFEKYKPDTVIHYAEQPSVPYSMLNRNKAAITITNNLISTLNVAYAVKIENPRKEAEEHYYNSKYTGLLELGLKPHFLTEEVLIGMFKVVEKYKANIQNHKIFRGIKWT